MTMKLKLLSAAISAALLSTAPATVSADDFTDALTGGKVKMDVRLRYESVDDSINKDADALTVRTRLGYETGSFMSMTAYVEFEDTRTAFGMDDYAPQSAGYAVVADPEVTELNQAFLLYTGLSDTAVKVGRQRVILDNARFVGNVGWRQDEQVYDALAVINNSLPDTTVIYGYVHKVEGILPKFDLDVSTHLFNASYTGLDFLKISAYAYLIELDATEDESNTFGIRFAGATNVADGVKLSYTLEYAAVEDDIFGTDNDADYMLGELGVTVSGITGKFGYEVLGSDDGTYGFQTPLATKHAFNGWADVFLGTPVDGLQDMYVSIGGKFAGVKLAAIYHDFSSDEGSTDYGTELDLVAAKKFTKNYSAGIKLASYSADNYKSDTDKVWIWGQLKF